MGGTFNDEMMAANERARARVESAAVAAPARPAGPAAASMPTPTRNPRRRGGTVVAMMVVFAVMVLFASALGGLFEMRGSDGATVVISSGPVTEVGTDGVAVVSWDTGGFAFDTPEGWTVDNSFDPAVVQLLTDQGDRIELRTADRWSGGGDAADHAFTVGVDLYDGAIGSDLDGLSGATFDAPHADTAVMLVGSDADVAVMVGVDGTTWAVIRHGDSGGDAWRDVILPSVRPS